MTNQDFVDWAFSLELRPEEKLTLVALAMAAGPDGGGTIALGKLSSRASCELLEALALVHRLQHVGAIVLHYAPRLEGDSPESDDVRFGLCIAGGTALA